MLDRRPAEVSAPSRDRSAPEEYGSSPHRKGSGMRIGLVADTHIPEGGPELPPEVLHSLSGCDRILHAGGLHVITVVEQLAEIAPTVVAAMGMSSRAMADARASRWTQGPRCVHDRDRRCLDWSDP